MKSLVDVNVQEWPRWKPWELQIVQILGRIGGEGRRRIRRGVIAGQLGAINLACSMYCHCVCVCVTLCNTVCVCVCVCVCHWRAVYEQGVKPGLGSSGVQVQVAPGSSQAAMCPPSHPPPLEHCSIPPALNMVYTWIPRQYSKTWSRHDNVSANLNRMVGWMFEI